MPNSPKSQVLTDRPLVAIGLVVFNSFPDAITLVGTAILIAAGLYIWHREKVTSTLSTPVETLVGEAVKE